MKVDDVREEFRFDRLPRAAELFGDLSLRLHLGCLKKAIGLFDERVQFRGGVKDFASQRGRFATRVAVEFRRLVEQFAEGINAARRAVQLEREEMMNVAMQLAPSPTDPRAINLQHSLGQLHIMPMSAPRQPIGQHAVAVVSSDG